MASYAEHRVLSGVTPSGVLHLGNYFGAITQHVAMQDEFPGECYYFIADYHSLTSLRDADKLREWSRDIAITYLALGHDPSKAHLFRQSDVPEVTELTWLLATVTGKGLLERAHSYKDKVANGLKPSMGLFTYPILMAADILIYGSTLVPVGKDQVQHVEFAQDMATYFNEAFPTSDGPVLRRPEWRLSKTPKVPGLDGQKMSKSYGNTIPLFESGKKLKKIIGKVVTNSIELGDPMPMEGCNVAALLRLFSSDAEMQQLAQYYATGSRDDQPFGYGHAKQMLTEKMLDYFADARARREHLIAHPDEVDEVLANAAKKARAEARDTIDRCRRACGLT